MGRFVKVLASILITIIFPLIAFSANIRVPGDQPTIQAGINAAIATSSFPSNDVVKIANANSGLMAYWSFDNGTGIDNSGHNHDGTLYGTTVITGVFGNGLEFDGIDDYMDIGDADQLENTPALTLSLWLRFYSFGVWGDGSAFMPIITKWYSTEVSGRNSYHLFEAGGQLDFAIQDSNYATAVSLCHHSMSLNQWYHVAVVFDSGHIAFYVQGSLIFDSTLDVKSIGNSTEGLRVANWFNLYNQNYRLFHGSMDDIRIYDKALTQAEVLSLSSLENPPYLQNIGPKTAIEGDTIKFRVFASDLNGTTPMLETYFMPFGAMFVDSGNGAGGFYWKPSFSSVGQHNVLFVASDGQLADSEIVTITVTPAPPSIAGLAIDNLYPATNLINHTPVISWDFSDPGNDNPQTTFEIAVGTDNDWITAELWNPAPFNSADTFVTYNGVPLADGQTCYLRIRVFNGILWSEWFTGMFRLNTVPTIPAMLYPLDSIVLNTLRPTLGITKASDPEDANLFYDFEVISISGHIMASEYEIPGSGETIQWQVPIDLSEDAIYRWHVRVTDLSEYSDWSEYQPFWINATEEPPFAFNLIKLPDTLRNMVFDMLPDFNWTESLDPDPRDPVHYTFYLSIDSNFLFTLTKDNLTLNSYAVVDSLAFATKYWWKVKSTDKTGRFTFSNTLSFRTWKLGDANGDWGINLLDVSFIINALYRGGTQPNPKYVGDFNGDCKMNLLDVSYLINYMYRDGPAPKIGCE
jgi:hypothetical protein